MTLLHLLKLLHARRGVPLLAAFIGVLLAFAWSRVAAKQYRAAAELIVNIRAPENLSGQMPVDQLTPDYLTTQIDVLKSDRIARLVVQRLQLANNVDYVKKLGWKGRGSIEDFVAHSLQQSLKIGSGSLISRVIDVTYTAPDPDFAASVANAFAQAYVDTTLDLQAQPARDSATWYQRRARDVQTELAAAERRLSIREQALNISSDTGQPDADDARLQALSAQLAAVQAQQAVTASRAGQAALPDQLANPVVQNLQAELAKLEAQRQQLEATEGPNHPDYRQVIAQIAALNSQIRQQKALAAKGSQAAAGQAGESVAALTRSVAEQKDRVIASRQRRDEIGVLQQDVKNLQTVYDQMAARRAALDLQGESTQSNVAILSPATAPDKPAWPKTVPMMVLGLIFGSVIGAGFVVLREIRDQRVRLEDDFEIWLGIPNLGVLELAEPQQRRLSQRAMKLLPFYVSNAE